MTCMEIETKFIRLRQPVALGSSIEGWRVCWVGGWDKGGIFYIVMVERKRRKSRRSSPEVQCYA